MTIFKRNPVIQGPQGQPGPTGPIGPKGDAGIAGNVAAKGDKGDAGAQGIQGPQGSQGPQGISGAQGPAGAIGATGTTGAAGATGATGSNAFTKSYEGIVLRSGAFPIIKSATVSSGVAVFYLTDDGTSAGNALFQGGIISDSINVIVNDATASYQMSWALSNSNKTITVTANKLTTANILTGLLGQAQANAAVVKLSVWGY